MASQTTPSDPAVFACDMAPVSGDGRLHFMSGVLKPTRAAGSSLTGVPVVVVPSPLVRVGGKALTSNSAADVLSPWMSHHCPTVWVVRVTYLRRSPAGSTIQRTPRRRPTGASRWEELTAPCDRRPHQGRVRLRLGHPPWSNLRPERGIAGVGCMASGILRVAGTTSGAVDPDGTGCDRMHAPLRWLSTYPSNHY